MKWYLDFGHGGKDSGAIGPTNLKESDIALKIGMIIKENLENALEKVITPRLGVSILVDRLLHRLLAKIIELKKQIMKTVTTL